MIFSNSGYRLYQEDYIMHVHDKYIRSNDRLAIFELKYAEFSEIVFTIRNYIKERLYED